MMHRETFEETLWTGGVWDEIPRETGSRLPFRRVRCCGLARQERVGNSEGSNPLWQAVAIGHRFHALPEIERRTFGC